MLVGWTFLTHWVCEGVESKGGGGGEGSREGGGGGSGGDGGGSSYTQHLTHR